MKSNNDDIQMKLEKSWSFFLGSIITIILFCSICYIRGISHATQDLKNKRVDYNVEEIIKHMNYFEEQGYKTRLEQLNKYTIIDSTEDFYFRVLD